MEQEKVNKLQMLRETVWRWEHYRLPQLGSEENLPLALPRIRLILYIMESQISYSQGQGAKERAGSG